MEIKKPNRKFGKLIIKLVFEYSEEGEIEIEKSKDAKNFLKKAYEAFNDPFVLNKSQNFSVIPEIMYEDFLGMIFNKDSIEVYAPGSFVEKESGDITSNGHFGFLISKS
jgi:DNA phosphorothioation-dependent restriction protein DptG